MGNSADNRLETIFHAAKECATPEQRESCLREACRGDDGLRAQVEALLAASDQAEKLFQAAGRPGTSEAPLGNPDLDIPTGGAIGRYKLLERLGEGGCGVVYLAEQEQPVRRQVALKVIKPGMDSRSVIARFEAERQALAMMEHPNIARVLDAGTTDRGLPYFVMELVRGVPITDYCRERNLSVEVRLALFIQVCHAVLHAHQKGVIHRDLKPSNILVVPGESAPVPKIIDFGIAKALQGSIAGETAFTAHGQFIGTAAYMSPEQAEAQTDIDTRSDIYALGVLLYELFTGETPFNSKELLAQGLDGARRTIRETEPHRPSTRLSLQIKAATKTRDSGASSGGSPGFAQPAKVREWIDRLRGDLDWIVMKCLEKDRSRRYETASELVADIERHLRSEPVLARTASTAYRVRKFVVRNRIALSAGIAVFAALLLGFATALRQAVRARAAEQHQSFLRAEAMAARATAESARSAEAQERSRAQEHLYDSFVDQARALRGVRAVGYREPVFSLIRDALRLDVTNKNLGELRREASSCLGDFVGLSPRTWTGFPSGVQIERTRMDRMGRVAAFALSDGSILLRQIPGGEQVGRLKPGGALRSFAFSLVADQLISLHSLPEQLERRVVCIWNAGPDGGWKESKRLTVEGALDCLASRNGDLLAIRQDSSAGLKLFDLRTDREVQTVPLPKGRIDQLALSQDGRLLAVEFTDSVSRGPSLQAWNVQSGVLLSELAPRLARPLSALHFSPDGKRFACASWTGSAIYDTEDFQQIFVSREHYSGPSRPAFGKSHLVSLPLTQLRRTRLFDADRGEETASLEDPDWLVEADFSADDRILLTAGVYHARLYQLDLGTERVSLPIFRSGVPGLSFSPDGSQLAAVDKDRGLTVSDSRTGKPLWSIALPGTGQSVNYSPDGRWIVTSCLDAHGVTLWEAQTGKLLAKLGNDRGGPVWVAAFSPDGRYLATAGTQNSPDLADGIVIWEVQPSSGASSLPEIRQAKSFGGGGEWWSLVWSADSQSVSVLDRGARERRGIYLWDFTRSGQPRRIAAGDYFSTQSQCLTPDGQSLLHVVGQGDVVTQALESGKTIARFSTADRKNPRLWSPHALALSPDGSKLALLSASALGVDIYDPRNGQLLYSFHDQKGTIWWLAWARAGDRLAVSRSTGEVSVWNLVEAERVLRGLGLSQ